MGKFNFNQEEFERVKSEAEKLYQTFFGKQIIIAVAVLFFLALGYFIVKRFILDKGR